ncbi:hypothetical protein CERSUDRAFT_91815 [Gelatoporia subvermispora B]|uniref:Uncharacterized protein n=1 Tax=Ceriporiopsis subvermispora (strain B) TaxID=914234 RepID=M2QVC3_CERS8|nr:hypothetical protein CERSUDRAFT_91815 [Gelatoporia subvermispora B]
MPSRWRSALASDESGTTLAPRPCAGVLVCCVLERRGERPRPREERELMRTRSSAAMVPPRCAVWDSARHLIITLTLLLEEFVSAFARRPSSSRNEGRLIPAGSAGVLFHLVSSRADIVYDLPQQLSNFDSAQPPRNRQDSESWQQLNRDEIEPRRDRQCEGQAARTRTPRLLAAQFRWSGTAHADVRAARLRGHVCARHRPSHPLKGSRHFPGCVALRCSLLLDPWQRDDLQDSFKARFSAATGQIAGHLATRRPLTLGMNDIPLGMPRDAAQRRAPRK